MVAISLIWPCLEIRFRPLNIKHFERGGPFTINSRGDWTNLPSFYIQRGPVTFSWLPIGAGCASLPRGESQCSTLFNQTLKKALPEWRQGFSAVFVALLLIKKKMSILTTLLILPHPRCDNNCLIAESSDLKPQQDGCRVCWPALILFT